PGNFWAATSGWRGSDGHSGGRRRGRGPGEREALSEGGAVPSEPAPFPLRLDALGDRLDAEVARGLEQLGGDLRLVRVLIHVADQLEVELDHIGLEPTQQVEAVVAGAD